MKIMFTEDCRNKILNENLTNTAIKDIVTKTFCKTCYMALKK